MTNREKINEMNNEQLASLLAGIDCGDCPVGKDVCLNVYADTFTCRGSFKRWLESEVTDE